MIPLYNGSTLFQSRKNFSNNLFKNIIKHFAWQNYFPAKEWDLGTRINIKNRSGDFMWKNSFQLLTGKVKEICMDEKWCTLVFWTCVQHIIPSGVRLDKNLFSFLSRESEKKKNLVVCSDQHRSPTPLTHLPDDQERSRKDFYLGNRACGSFMFFRIFLWLLRFKGRKKRF